VQTNGAVRVERLCDGGSARGFLEDRRAGVVATTRSAGPRRSARPGKTHRQAQSRASHARGWSAGSTRRAPPSVRRPSYCAGLPHTRARGAAASRRAGIDACRIQSLYTIDFIYLLTITRGKPGRPPTPSRLQFRADQRAVWRLLASCSSCPSW